MVFQLHYDSRSLIFPREVNAYTRSWSAPCQYIMDADRGDSGRANPVLVRWDAYTDVNFRDDQPTTLWKNRINYAIFLLIVYKYTDSL